MVNKKGLSSKAPQKGGLDWDAIRSGYAERRRQEGASEALIAAEQLQPNRSYTQAQVDARIERVNPSVKKPKKKNGGAGLGRGRGREPEFDRKRMVELYLEGKTVYDIMFEMGCTDTTVRRALQAAQVYDPNRDKVGRSQQTHCKRGHDLSVTGRKHGGKKGGRYCSACANIRNNKAKRKKEWNE